MTPRPSATGIDEAQVRADHPDWQIIHTDRDRWWAIPRPGTEHLRSFRGLEADTLEDLASALGEMPPPPPGPAAGD